MAIKNYYNILNIKPESSLDTIKKAFRTEVTLYHPDNNKTLGAKERFEDIIEAFNVLSDSDKRSTYDVLLNRHQNNLPAVLVQNEEGQYREWQKESKRKSEKYWDFPLTELLLLDILIEPGLIGGLLTETDNFLDGIGDAVGDIFDLF